MITRTFMTSTTEILKICDDIFLRNRARLVVAEPAYEAVIQYAVNSKADAAKVPLTPDYRHDLPKMAAANLRQSSKRCGPFAPTRRLRFSIADLTGNRSTLAACLPIRAW